MPIFSGKNLPMCLHIRKTVKHNFVKYCLSFILKPCGWNHCFKLLKAYSVMHACTCSYTYTYTNTYNTPTTLSCAACVQNVFSKEEGICCCRENSALTKLTGSLINYYKPWSLINLVLINTLEWGIDFWGFNVFSPPSQGRGIELHSVCFALMFFEKKGKLTWFGASLSFNF